MKRLSTLLVPNNKKLAGVILILISITTGIVAQIAFFYSIQGQDLPGYFDIPTWWGKTRTNASPLPGLFLYMLAAVFFVGGLRFLNDSAQAFTAHPVSISQRKPKFGFWITSLGLAGIIAIHVARTYPNDPAGYAFVALWVLSIILLVVSVLMDEGWRPASRQEMLDWFKIHRTELLVIATIMVTAFFIRILALDSHPYPFNNDEGQMGAGGVCIIQGRCPNFFNLAWAGQDTLAFLPYGVSIAIFGNVAFAVRLVSVLVGTLSTLAVYLFAREVFNKQIAWVAGLMLATLPVHVQFSRQGIDNIIDSFSAPLILWLLFRGVKHNSRLSFLSAGITAGLCIYTYPGSLLAPVLGVFALAVMAVQTRGFLQAHYRNIFVFVLAAVIVTLPMLGYYATHSGAFLVRMQTEGILQNGILQSRTEATGKSAAEILAGQFLRSSLVFIATGAPANFFNSPAPYLTPVAALLFVLGLVYAAWHIKNPIYLTLFVWFWAPVILGSTLTSGPPTSQRMLMSMPAVAIITAIGMAKTIEALQKSGKTIARFGPLLLLILVLYIGYQDINYYFLDYRNGHFYEDPVNEFAYETHWDITPLHNHGRLYLMSDPGIPYLSFPNFNFFAPDVEKFDFSTVSRTALAGLPEDKDALFIASPNRKSDLELVMRWIPDGAWNVVRRRYQPDQILYYSYKITKQQLEGFKP